MDPTQDEDPALAELHKLSARTTPTWEMELLVSGATVFGLMQLPEVADRAMFALYNTTMPGIAGLVVSLWLYLKFVLFTLIATFIAHLCLRGYWVALAGLSSVYPAGIRWDVLRTKMGPLYLESSRRQLGTMPEVIERADNRASRVFGIGFGMAMTMLVPILLVLVMMFGLYVYRFFGGTSTHAYQLAFGAIVAVTVPWALVFLWDRQRGERVSAASLEGRALRGLYRMYATLGFTRASNPLMTLFSTNEGTRSGVVIAVTMTVIFLFVLIQGIGDRLGLETGDYRGLPSERTTTGAVVPALYASQRGNEPMLLPPPHIPDPVVRGDWLRVFIPYFPMQHEEAMQRDCPAALAGPGDSVSDREDEAAAAWDLERVTDDARLACLQRIHVLTIDGEVVSVPFDAAEDPQTGQRGVLAMIRVRDLAPGRHELAIAQAQRDRAEDEPPLRPWRIPFWK